MAANAQAAIEELSTTRADLARATELGIENADSSEEMLQSSLAWEARHNQVVGMLNNANTQVVTISRERDEAEARLASIQHSIDAQTQQTNAEAAAAAARYAELQDCQEGLRMLDNSSAQVVRGCPGAGRPLGMRLAPPATRPSLALNSSAGA
ncbi:hypothetical protein WJX84_011743 [Apatococcus fuscideae]|uniref:Uncharacterized protein n=1 Tax=Apatococcus fuscideae TaxID=2026836 RepID=A0AAW1TGQ9_9CHLO